MSDEEDQLVKLDGLDEAIVGQVTRCGGMAALCYSRAMIIAILMERDGMDEEEADEFFEFNIAGLWAGEGTPVFLEPW